MLLHEILLSLLVRACLAGLLHVLYMILVLMYDLLLLETLDAFPVLRVTVTSSGSLLRLSLTFLLLPLALLFLL